jgi:hypothetical protein
MGAVIARWSSANVKAGDKIANGLARTLVYLEGDAKMDVYEKDGQNVSSLSLIQTKIDVLKRPVPKAEEAEAA